MARRTALALSAVLALSACNTEGLAFVEDRRVTIIEPAALSKVTLPVTVRWSYTDFEVIAAPDGSDSDDRGRFAVFVDRTPMSPGEDLRSLGEDDELCAKDPTCPDEAWLKARNVHLTSEPALTIKSLPDFRDDGRGLDQHSVTVVLLDGRDQRIGESAFTAEFIVDHSADPVEIQ